MHRPLVGFAFPFRIVEGGIARSREMEKIRDNVQHLLATRLGERPMLRGYGGGVHHRLHEPNDATLRTLLAHEIEQGLRAYLPDVRLTAPLQLSSRGGELRIGIEYAADPRGVVHRLEFRIP